MDIHHLHLQSSKNLSFCIFISLLLLTFFLLKVQSSIETTSFSFNKFNPDMTEINFEGQAYVEGTSIQLTKSRDDLSAGDDNVGRATYYKPIHLWDDKSENIADFRTSFSFVINSHGNESRGNGFAFFLTSNGSKLPPFSGGPHLGLLTDTNDQPPFVAVEFDTGIAYWDPADGGEHIGIGLNSLSSIVGTNWIWNDIENGGIIQAWIEYNSSSKILSVNVTNGYQGSDTRDYSYDLSLLELIL